MVDLLAKGLVYVFLVEASVLGLVKGWSLHGIFLT